MGMRTRRGAVTALVIAGVAAAPAAAAPKPVVQVASVDTGGALANDDSHELSLSADGGYVAFTSAATNLVPGDTNGAPDVFVRDLSRGLTRRATLDTAGEQAAGTAAGHAYVSKHGRYVVFTSDAGNLVPDDTNNAPDVFVRDLRFGITTRASLTSTDGQIGSSSVSAGISGDGRYVVFTASCGCVVPGDTNGADDVFVRDLRKGTTRRASVATGGGQGDGQSFGAAISADGRYVAFTSQATDLVPGDTNGTTDVFRHDLRTGVTTRVSVGPGGAQTVGSRPGDPGFASGRPSLSDNGRLVAFTSFGAGLVAGPTGHGDVYVRDVKTGTTTLASPGVGGAASDAGADVPVATPRIAGEGRYVAFVSWATNLVAGDTNGDADGFLRDLKKGTTTRVSLGNAGEQGNAPAGFDIGIDEDGETAAFTSWASNLVAGDTNDRMDVFARRLKK